MKVETRCSICTLDERDELHNDYYNNQMSLADIARKYFPEKKPKDMARTLTTHLRDHFSVEKDVAAVEVSQHLPAIQAQLTGLPMPPSSQRVYDEYVKKRLSSTATLEASLRTLMEMLNLLMDEWVAIHQVTQCSVCGRDDNKESLGKVLMTVKEIRELHTSLTKMKNPMEIFKKFFEQTFLAFSDKVMELYMEKLREKGRIINEVVNQYLRNEVSAAFLSRRIAEMEDLGSGEMEREAKDQFKRILSAVRKEMDLKV